MQTEQKVPESPLSTLRSESDSSSIKDRSPVQQTQRRFTRSGSHSRSKSRDDHREDISSRFFVKNHKQTTPAPEQHSQTTQNRFLRMANQPAKRQTTPAKNRKIEGEILTQGHIICDSVERELQWLKLQHRCQLTEAENLRLQKINKNLQSQLVQLHQQFTEIIGERNFYKEKVKNYEQRQGKQPKERTNNLLKLKKQIAKHKAVDSSASQHMKHQLQTLQSQLQILRQSLLQSQALRRQAELMAENQRSERERFLEQLVQQLRIKGSERDELIEKMKIHLNILMIRQAKQEDKAELFKNQEIQTLKRKYATVLKKYHQASQELAAFRRMQERSTTRLLKEERSAESSLSLSP